MANITHINTGTAITVRDDIVDYYLATGNYARVEAEKPMPEVPTPAETPSIVETPKAIAEEEFLQMLDEEKAEQEPDFSQLILDDPPPKPVVHRRSTTRNA